MTVIEPQTTYTDSGFDCDHCGGRILHRIDSEADGADSHCYECESCGCQWTLKNQPLKVGRFRQCRSAQDERRLPSVAGMDAYAWWVVIGFAGLVVLFALRFAGPLALRFILLLAIGAAAVLLGLRLGRHWGK